MDYRVLRMPNQQQRKLFRFEFSLRQFAVMLIGIALNFVLFFIASRLQLPFWLDLTGTAWVAYTLGPIAGMVVALVNNLILAFGFFGFSTFGYVLVSFGVALLVGIYAQKGDNSLLRVVGICCLCYLFNVVLCSFISVIIAAGDPGDYWGSIFYQMVQTAGFGNFFAAFVSNLIIKLADITITGVLVALLVFLTPRSLKGNY